MNRDPIGYISDAQAVDHFLPRSRDAEVLSGYVDNYNLYEYVGGGPTNLVDPSGLYQVVGIVMGHYGECKDFLGNVQKPSTNKGKLGAVCCFHDRVMEDLPYKNPVPDWPSEDDVRDTDEDGRLDCEDVDDFVKKAWRSTAKYLKSMCDKGVSNPSAVIECSPDMEDCVEDLVDNGDLTRNPCDIEVEYDCKTGKWTIRD